MSLPMLLARPAPLCLALASAFALAAHAEDTSLKPVVVTAASYAQPVQDVQASVQVLSRRDLDASAGISLVDNLKQAVGVDTRGTSTNATVSMRGMTSSGTLILYDGLRRTQKYGSRDLNLFSSEDTEQIEIVRGPMSALYGADASGGVINIISKQPKYHSGLHGGASLLYGLSQGNSRDTDLWKGYVEYGGENVTHRLSVEQRNRDEYRVVDNSYRADLKGSDETYVNYHGGLRVAPGHTVKLTLERVLQNDRAPDQLASAPFTRFVGYEQERRDYAGLNYTGDIGPGQLVVDMARGRSDAKTTRAYPLIEDTHYTQTQLGARYTLPLGQHMLTIGLGRQTDQLRVANNTSREGDRRNQYGLAQGDFTLLPDLHMLAGVRYDSFNEFGHATTPRLSLQYTPSNWRFRLGYGEAFRAPSVLEQYATFRRGTFLILGNDALVPEESRSVEAAIGYQRDDWNLELAAYRTRASNLITTVSRARQASDPAGVLSRSVYANVGRATIEGIELSGQWRFLPGWSLTGGYEHIRARDDSSGQRLTGRPGSIARAGLRAEVGAWRADLQGRYYFNYYNSHNTLRGVNLSSNHGLTDFKLAYQVNKQISLAAGVDNLLNRQAPDNWGSMYALEDPPTRFFYLSAQYRF